MPTINQIKHKFSDNLAIQCVCEAFPNGESPIAMRARLPMKVLQALMWNRGVHMVMAGITPKYTPEYNRYDIWKDVIQMTIDVEVFDVDDMMIVHSAVETPYGILVSFETPLKLSENDLFRKKLLKIKRKFAEYDSWGTSQFIPLVP